MEDCEPGCGGCVEAQAKNTVILDVALEAGCTWTRWCGRGKAYTKIVLKGSTEHLRRPRGVTDTSPCKHRVKRDNYDADEKQPSQISI